MSLLTGVVSSTMTMSPSTRGHWISMDTLEGHMLWPLQSNFSIIITNMSRYHFASLWPAAYNVSEGKYLFFYGNSRCCVQWEFTACSWGDCRYLHKRHIALIAYGALELVWGLFSAAILYSWPTVVMAVSLARAKQPKMKINENKTQHEAFVYFVFRVESDFVESESGWSVCHCWE